MSEEAAIASWRSSGRATWPDAIAEETRVAARAAACAAPVVAAIQGEGWVWYESTAPVDEALTAHVAELAARVVGLPVVVGEAAVRRYPRGAYADADPYGAGFVRFVLDLSDPGVVGGDRRHGDTVWPSRPGELLLWWDDGETPAAVALVHAGERVELTGVLGAAS